MPVAYESSWVESELQLLTCATDTASPDPRHICNLYCSSWQLWILNPLNKSRDWTLIFMCASQVCFRWVTMGTPKHLARFLGLTLLSGFLLTILLCVFFLLHFLLTLFLAIFWTDWFFFFLFVLPHVPSTCLEIICSMDILMVSGIVSPSIFHLSLKGISIFSLFHNNNNYWVFPQIRYYCHLCSLYLFKITHKITNTFFCHSLLFGGFSFQDHGLSAWITAPFRISFRDW